MILDDSTSSVDVTTDSHIQAALETLMKGRTSFVIAQRISTVMNADKILVLEKGEVVAQGKHAQLMEEEPIYAEIYNSQILAQTRWSAGCIMTPRWWFLNQETEPRNLSETLGRLGNISPLAHIVLQFSCHRLHPTHDSPELMDKPRLFPVPAGRSVSHSPPQLLLTKRQFHPFGLG